MKKVLIILASYNGSKFIKEQIETIFAQKKVNINLFIFDDQSHDDTCEVIKNLPKNYKIKLFINSEPSGSAAKNFCNAIKSITEDIYNQYDFIALSDQDDLWLPNKLDIATNALEHEKAEFYSSNLILWEQYGNKKSLLKKTSNQKRFDFLFEGASAGCTYVFTSKFANHLKIKLDQIDYENWKYFSHDWLIYFISRLGKFKVIIDQKAEILYRIHIDNVYGQLNVNSLKSIKNRFDIVLNGWYFKQIEGFSKLLNPNSVEFKIYHLYTKNMFTRFFLLFKYNFKLMRSKRKYIKFALLSIIPRFSN
jgi:rhamnosyltransferase